MKELSRKIVEAGLVPKHTLQMMKHWKLVPEDATEADVPDADIKKMHGMVDDISELLEEGREIPELRETDLDIDVLWVKHNMPCQVIIVGDHPVTVDTFTARDRSGSFVFMSGPAEGTQRVAELAARPGNRINWEGNQFDILEVHPSFADDRPKYYVCVVQEVPEHAQMRALRKVGP